MNTVWTKETSTSGNTIVIRRKEVEWASYDLPSTSHSGGGAQVYQFADVFEGSGFYNSVVAVFGLSVAQDILYAVSNRDLIEEHFIANQSESKFTKWLTSLPEDETIEAPWRNDIGKFEYIHRDFSPLLKFGITVKQHGHHLQLFDSEKMVPLFSLMFTDTFDFAAVPDKSIRIICTRTELFIIHKRHQSIEVIVPFQNWKENWKNMSSEISWPHLFSDHILVRFNINRIRNEEGDYLLKLDLSGTAIAKKDITPKS